MNFNPSLSPLQLSSSGQRSYRNSKLIQDPLSLCFSERFLILEKPKTKSKKVFWSSLKIGDILRISIILKEVGYNGKTYQNSCTVDNESTDQTCADYPINVLRHLKRIKYKQLDK